MRQAPLQDGRAYVGLRLAPDLVRLVDAEAAAQTGGNRTAMIERILEERYGTRSPVRAFKAALEQRFTTVARETSSSRRRETRKAATA